MHRRTAIALGITAAACGLTGFTVMRHPGDTTPERAYLRLASALGRGDVRPTFTALDDEAQRACHDIRDHRQKTSDRIQESYPEPERSKLLALYRAHAEAPDGADVWVEMAARLGWIARLRRDLSGVARVEVDGDRAVVETARGTRYPFRRREGGLWGLSMFTAELVAEAERAARDWDVVERAALDYDGLRR
ncbi:MULTISPECIES: hypothetical protein [Sorangium]|uniref:Uncharacterized protein n=1 Tax=Sorangium cellulosum TaxID=56 RepID=A0A4P2QGI4_SORCE|nr:MULTISPECIES: hypothetical protein [Sorangium]AUX28618.1 hypothetical protein SOCE836_006970 [Sorangium cellulosum]WCQ88013.1 hypothetical protein NQZ70_00684 [Sorangium sp. Soce836]